MSFTKRTQKYRILLSTSKVAGKPTSSWLEKQTTEEDKTKGFSCHKNASTSTHDKFFNTMEQNGA